MNVLAIGDVVAPVGAEFLRNQLPKIKREYNIDLVIANGENSAEGNGITPHSADFLFDSGVDVITTGNHAFRRREIYDYFDDHEAIIRPLNFPEETTPGKGYCEIDFLKYKVIVVNLMGNIYMESTICPFRAMDTLLSKVSKRDIVLVDFHAEATSEKRAMGFYLDGKVSAVFGTHTHVATADECILKNGTGYITDIGMTGPIDSVLGVKPKNIIDKLKNKLPVKFETASGKCKMECIIFKIDEKTKKTEDINRFIIV